MHIKKLILLLFLAPVLAQAQKTTGPNYTYIAQRYEWLAGVFKALGIPAGDSAQFQTGQEMRAGAMYYDSVGVDSGLYVWSGLAWNVAGTSYTDADARAAISLTTTGTSGAATYSSATGVFNIPVYAGTPNANAGAFYRWLIPSTQEIKTFAPGYGILLDSISNADAITAILDSATVFPDIRASIESPNLIVDSIGVSGTDVIVARNDSLLHRLIATGINYILVDTIVSTGEIRIRLDTASSTLKDYIAANGGGGSSYTFSTGLTEAAGTVTNNLSTGVSGGQTIIGGTASGNSLTYSSTSNATKGSHIWGTTAKMEFDEQNNKLRVGTSTDMGSYNIQSGTGIAVGRTQAAPISKFTFSNNTTGSAGIGFYTSTDVLQSLIRASGPSIGTTLMGISKNNSMEIFGNSGPLFLYGNNHPLYIGSNPTAPVITAITAGRVGFNTITAPTAWAHLPAGTTAASTAPLKFTTGTALTTPEDGAMEYHSSHLYFTVGSTRYQLDQQAKPTLTKNATIETPGAAENLGWFRTPVAITVTNTHAVLVGSGSPSVTYQISFGTDITSLTNVYTAGQTVTSTTTGTAASGVNDATIPANSWVRITTSAATDVSQISLSITYTED